MDINAYDANSLAIAVDFSNYSTSSLFERYFLRRNLASTTSNVLMVINIAVKDEYLSKFN